MNVELSFASASVLLRLMQEGKVTARELLELQLSRIERFNEKINAVIYVDAEEARKSADRADKEWTDGRTRGNLHGLPMTVKENQNVLGWPTTYGNPTCANSRAKQNGEPVHRLLRAGAVIFGKTNVPFNSADFQTFNAIYGSTRNPWDLARSPGGSSGGSAAALAAGLTPAELGSDIAGSIRFPAHFCGVYGHKPTHGTVSTQRNLRPGVWIENDLSTCGPLARSAEDLELLFRVIAGSAGPAATGWQLALPPARAKRLQDFRIGVIETSPSAPIDLEYQAAIKSFVQRLEQAGATVVRGAHPSFDHDEAYGAYISLLRGSASARLSELDFNHAVEIASRLAVTDQSYLAMLRRAQAQSHRSYIRSEEIRARVKLAWAEFFQRFDVLLAPVTLSAAYLVDEETIREERKIQVSGQMVDYNDQLFWAGYSTMPSLPVTTIPIGALANGLPVGINVVGPYLEDFTPLAFGKAASAVAAFVAPPGFQ